MGALTNDTMANSRRRFNAAHQLPPGSTPQVIMPPGVAQPARAPVQLSMIGAPHASVQPVPAPPPPPVVNPAPDNPPAEDPAPEDPPDKP